MNASKRRCRSSSLRISPPFPESDEVLLQAAAAINTAQNATRGKRLIGLLLSTPSRRPQSETVKVRKYGA
jgi:hypothetical protein